MTLRLCVVVFTFVLLPRTSAYVSTSSSQCVPFSGLSRSKPLSTANSGFQISIPRLEPGLRVKKGSSEFNAHYIQTIPSNPLEWLIHAEAAAAAALQREQIASADIFRDAGTALRTIANSFLKYVRKIIAATVVIASSLSSAGMRRVAFANSVVAAITAAPRRVQAVVAKKYRQLSPTQKLATTPLFFVCNSGGNPYLQDDIQAGKPEQRVIVYFMSSEDANDYLNEMAQGNPQNINEFRVMTTSMEKVVNKIQSRKQSRKLGRYKMSSVYRIQPSSRQCENAERVAGAGDVIKGAEALQGVSIPMFSAKGLAIKRANGEVVTPFYFAYEDLKEDWSKLVEQSEAMEADGESKSRSVKKIAAKPKVEVRDFVEVMCLSQGITKDTLSAHINPPVADETGAIKTRELAATPGIVPPRREIEMIRRLYRNEAGIKNEFQEAKIVGAK